MTEPHKQSPDPEEIANRAFKRAFGVIFAGFGLVALLLSIFCFSNEKWVGAGCFFFAFLGLALPLGIHMFLFPDNWRGISDVGERGNGGEGNGD